jgi:hypothetical protein
VNFTVEVALMPRLVANLIAPKRDQPDVIRIANRTDNFHAKKAVGIIDVVRPIAESFLDLGGHAIGNREFADNYIIHV